MTAQEEAAENNIFLLKRKAHNNGVIYPHDVVKCVLPLVRSLHTFLRALNVEARTYNAYNAILKTYSLGADVDFVVKQWQQLPGYLTAGKVLPVVDVSESMDSTIGDMTAMDIAVSLGLYCAGKHDNTFKNLFVKFTQEGSIDKLLGNVFDNAFQMVRDNSFYSMSMHRLFERLLNVATANNTWARELPDSVLVLSNKAFNDCMIYNEHNVKIIKERYEKAGYAMPKVVFWNLREQNKVTVHLERCGATVINGFRPVMLMNVLNNDINGLASA